MRVKLDGKVALVTGAGRGIGKGCALELARCGADVVVNDRPGSPDLVATAEQVGALGRTCTAVEADVFSRAGCEQLVAGAIAAAGQIDILVSNPACSIRAKFMEFAPNDFERVIAGTLTSGFHMSQLVARHMVERGGGGKMVFISSVHAIMPFALSVAYNAAKAGLNNMAYTIALELAPQRINVNCIEPGWIDTPGERGYFSEEHIQAAGRQLPWGRLGTPADIGKAAAFLASDAADYITGAVLRVDGGFWLKDMRE
jgi:glucose 1-dehydrogenase